MVFFEYLFILFVISISFSCAFIVRSFIWLAKKNVGGGGILAGNCSHSVVLLCVSLSIAILCVAVFLTMLDWAACLKTIDIADFFYYCVLFWLIFICTVFFKVLAPVFLGLYILYCGIFAFLYIDSYDVAQADTIPHADSVHLITISPKNLLPLPQQWQSTNDDSELFSNSIEKFNSVPFLQDSIRFISSLIIK